MDGSDMTVVELKNWRKRLNLSQTAAAEVLGMSRAGYTRMESTGQINRRTEISCHYLWIKEALDHLADAKKLNKM